MGLFRRRPKLPPTPTIDVTAGDPAGAALLDSLKRQDWRSAHEFLSSVQDPDDFAHYVNLCTESEGLQSWVDTWVEATPRSTLPVLVKGAHGIVWAWQARGAGLAKNTSQAQFRMFDLRLKMAEDCLDEVTERNPDDPTAWAFLITTAMGRGLDIAERQRRFTEAVRRHPGHLVAHHKFHYAICRKWGGSHELMHQFADETAAAAPLGSPLGGLVVSAHLERWLMLPGDEDLAYLRQPHVRTALLDAADRSVRHPAYRKGPGWPGLHNRFAMALWLAEEHAAAAERFDVLGDLVTEDPWDYLDSENPALRFAIAREQCFKDRG
ncbi:MAG: DUF4034 domain-containing protein [Micromonosporaceae bacterium]